MEEIAKEAAEKAANESARTQNDAELDEWLNENKEAM
jgi:hypothetical protein